MNLHHAAEHFDIELAKKLLKSEVDINKSDEFGQTPLHIAIDSAIEEAIYTYDTEKRMVEPKLELIKLLISNGADYNKPDNSGKSPMDCVLERKNKQFILKIKEIINK